MSDEFNSENNNSESTKTVLEKFDIWFVESVFKLFVALHLLVCWIGGTENKEFTLEEINVLEWEDLLESPTKDNSMPNQQGNSY